MGKSSEDSAINSEKYGRKRIKIGFQQAEKMGSRELTYWN
jgi:hypothetical protein